jgi:hypothetical protein
MRNDVLGLIKWQQMAFLGNPQYGVEPRCVAVDPGARVGGQRGAVAGLQHVDICGNGVAVAPMLAGPPWRARADARRRASG